MTVTFDQARDQLAELLDRVAGGEEVTITRDGVNVARLVPTPPRRPSRLPMSVDEMRAFRARHKLEGITIRELIEEGRRR